MVKHARAAHAQGDSRRARALLNESVPLLTGHAVYWISTTRHQRLAAVEGAWLSLARLLHGDLEQACDAPRLDRVLGARGA
jgi:hypothetical protein